MRQHLGALVLRILEHAFSSPFAGSCMVNWNGGTGRRAP
jgi:hypothetical protein